MEHAAPNWTLVNQGGVGWGVVGGFWGGCEGGSNGENGGWG